MQRTFFITGTDTGVGKTVLTALLARFLTDQGRKVAAFKPVCSGGRDDARALHAALEGALSLDEINPWHFRAAIAPSLAARREHQSISLAQVLGHIRARQNRFEVTLVEGAGGLLSPLGDGRGGRRPPEYPATLTERRYQNNFDSRDLILALRAAPIIVAPNQLGVVNHLLLTLEALPKRCRAKAKIVLMTPAKPDSATASNARLLGESFPLDNVFTLPRLDTRQPPAGARRNPRIKRVLKALIQP